jgi:hypothetical protein
LADGTNYTFVTCVGMVREVLAQVFACSGELYNVKDLIGHDIKAALLVLAAIHTCIVTLKKERTACTYPFRGCENVQYFALLVLERLGERRCKAHISKFFEWQDDLNKFDYCILSWFEIMHLLFRPRAMRPV